MKAFRFVLGLLLAVALIALGFCDAAQAQQCGRAAVSQSVTQQPVQPQVAVVQLPAAAPLSASSSAGVAATQSATLAPQVLALQPLASPGGIAASQSVSTAGTAGCAGGQCALSAQRSGSNRPGILGRLFTGRKQTVRQLTVVRG